MATLKLLDAAKKTGQTALLLGVWGLVLFAGVMTAVEIKNTLAAWHQTGQSKKAAQASHAELHSIPLSKGEYEAIAKTVTALHKNLEITPEKDSLSLSAGGLDQYGAWRLAIEDVLVAVPGVKWQAKSVCMGDGCGKAHFSVELSGSKQTFVVQQ